MQGSNDRVPDVLTDDCRQHFTALVEGVGIKRFASCLKLSTRQVNRMLSNAQPNPVERIIRCLQAAEVDMGDRVLDFICQEMGGHFVRQEGINDAAVNAVRECAEAIAAISDGQVGEVDMKEIREAISALSSLILSLRDDREQQGKKP
jgi:hypothetical protein